MVIRNSEQLQPRLNKFKTVTVTEIRINAFMLHQDVLEHQQTQAPPLLLLKSVKRSKHTFQLDTKRRPRGDQHDTVDASRALDTAFGSANERLYQAKELGCLASGVTLISM